MTRDKKLILLVDDDPAFLEIMSTKLNFCGFEIASAHNAKEGVAETEKLMPDLVLMDINMPDATGTDAALAIKQNQKTKDVKIIFLTSMQDPWPSVNVDKNKLSKALGMDDFLEKTESLDVIVEKVRSILAA